MNRVALMLLGSILYTSANSYALDSSDVGTYAVVHRDGHVTNFTFYASVSATKWNIEQKVPNGSWSNVTCETDCILRESNPKAIRRFFPASVLKDIEPNCVHNSAFAFCNFTHTSRPGSKGYVMVALVTQQPTPVRLRKLSNERLAP